MSTKVKIKNLGSDVVTAVLTGSDAEVVESGDGSAFELQPNMTLVIYAGRSAPSGGATPAGGSPTPTGDPQLPPDFKPAPSGGLGPNDPRLAAGKFKLSDFPNKVDVKMNGLPVDPGSYFQAYADRLEEPTRTQMLGDLPSFGYMLSARDQNMTYEEAAKAFVNEQTHPMGFPDSTQPSAGHGQGHRPDTSGSGSPQAPATGDDGGTDVPQGG